MTDAASASQGRAPSSSYDKISGANWPGRIWSETRRKAWRSRHRHLQETSRCLIYQQTSTGVREGWPEWEEWLRNLVYFVYWYIHELMKVSSMGWKGKSLVRWAEKDWKKVIYGLLLVGLDQNQSYNVTAMKARSYLFNLLITINENVWQTHWSGSVLCALTYVFQWTRCEIVSNLVSVIFRNRSFGDLVS
jgi:hypothetical protein